MPGTHIVILITTSSKEEAERIAYRLVDEKLAACVNIVSGVKSIFRWEGKIDEAQEFLLIAKTRLDKVEKLIQTVKEIHSYTVPEIIALPIIAGHTSYLEWITQSLTNQKTP